MSCLTPLEIINPTRYLNEDYNNRLLLRVACGKCAGCKQDKQNEYYYRAIHEFKACVKSGGYMLFDTLTYRDDVLPHLQDFIIEDIPAHLNYPCFSYSDVKAFLKNLRSRLKWLGYDPKDRLKTFYCMEYGTDPNCTHRPHYHILFFVYGSFIPFDVLSLAIGETWKFGRTDGMPTYSKFYVRQKNVVRSSVADSVRVCQYVCKYVNKDSAFDSEIRKRIFGVLWHFALSDSSRFVDVRQCSFDYVVGDDGEIRKITQTIEAKVNYDKLVNFLNSSLGRQLFMQLCRLCQQTHKQGQGFGASAIESIDMDLLERTGCVSVVADDKPVMFLALPMYLKRKMFYKQVKVDGVKRWTLNNKGLLYKQARKKYLHRTQLERLKLANQVNNFGFSEEYLNTLVDYEQNKRGIAFGSCNREFDYNGEKLSSNLYSYSLKSDMEYYKNRFVTKEFIGNNVIGLRVRGKFAAKSQLLAYVKRNVTYNQAYEDDLVRLRALQCESNCNRQLVFDFKEDLNRIYKSLQ